MAITLKFTVSDSSENDVDLVDALYGGVTKYQPTPAKAGEDSVSESISAEFRPGGTDAPRTKINMINRMFVLARARKASGKGPRVFLYCETSSLSTPYRAEIYDGTVSLTDDAFGIDVAQNWYQVVIAITRSPWWESTTETQIALTNGNGTNNTSGLTITNADSASADNWFNIPTSQLLSNTSGDVEAPVRLEFTNSYASGLSSKLIYVGMIKSNSFASNRIPVLEGESGTAGAGVTSGNSPLTGTSNGNYKSVQWTGTSSTTVITWQIPAADLQRMRGLRFLPILRLANALGTADYDFGWQMVLSTLVPLTPIKWFRASATDQFIPLNSGEIPPYLSDASNLDLLTFTLVARRATGGTNTADVDAVYLMPCDPMHGGLRIFTPRGVGLSQNEKLIDDGIAQQTYSDNTANGGGVQGYYRSDGNWLTIRPNCNNQFYVLQTDSNNVPYAARTMTVKAYYRPRRSTL